MGGGSGWEEGDGNGRMERRELEENNKGEDMDGEKAIGGGE